MPPRCAWVTDDPLYLAYHDHEWGVPVHDDQALFELLVLEGAQAGLNWLTILKKRDGYRAAFVGFDPVQVARYTEDRIEALLQNPAIVRNRLKVNAAVQNARAFLDVQAAFGSFDAYVWRFVDGTPIINHWQTLHAVPSETPISKRLSKDLKQRGFRFVGPTICYVFMQAAGLINDHTTDCFRHPDRP